MSFSRLSRARLIEEQDGKPIPDDAEPPFECAHAVSHDRSKEYYDDPKQGIYTGIANHYQMHYEAMWQAAQDGNRKAFHFNQVACQQIAYRMGWSRDMIDGIGLFLDGIQ